MLNKTRHACAIVLFLLAAPVSAGPAWQDYDAATFEAALGADDSILVDVAADWCPTCKAQRPLLDELRVDERLGDVHFVRVDYDAHKEFLAAHRVPRQSTILLFMNGREVGRSIAETNRERLREFVLGTFAD
jgi:thioredoxin 1